MLPEKRSSINLTCHSYVSWTLKFWQLFEWLVHFMLVKSLKKLHAEFLTHVSEV